jgi:hypothetical protein
MDKTNNYIQNAVRYRLGRRLTRFNTRHWTAILMNDNESQDRGMTSVILRVHLAIRYSNLNIFICS